MSSLVKSKNQIVHPSEFVIFRVGDVLCALNIEKVQEIKILLKITKVHHAPEYVRGVINLRGRIVTIIDLRCRFGYESVDFNDSMRIIVIKKTDEHIGLLVDEVDDAALVNYSDITEPPANVKGIEGQFFTGVCKMENTLVAILDVEKITANEQDTNE